MQIRSTVQTDDIQLKSIFRYSTECSETYADWYFEKCRSFTQTIIAEENGKILSALEQTPYTLNINHTPIKSRYISTVSTLPEHRGKGYARILITQALRNMKENGAMICFAVPPSYKMFNKFGFRLTHQFKQYNIDIKNIPAYQMTSNAERVGKDDVSAALLAGIYDKFTLGKNGYVIRTPDIWKRITEDLHDNFGGYTAIVRSADGTAVGYIMYIIRGREMHIYETAYVNHSAYTAIMSYIRSHITQVDTVIMKAPSDDLSYLDFSDNRTAVGLYPLVTSRITDVKAALEVAASKGFAGNLNIQVIDRIIEDNNAVYSISQDGVAIAGEGVAPDIMCDVGTLTQLFMGFISAAEAEKLNLVSGDIQSADRLFPKKDNYINMLLV